MVMNWSATIFFSVHMAWIEMTNEIYIYIHGTLHIDVNSHELAYSVRGMKGGITHRVATAQRLDIKERKDLVALKKLE